MNREDIIRMAREASLGVQVPDILLPVFERFAVIVASAEREAIAKMVEPWLMPEYVEKIRNRGQA